jgi:hypothetical protein
MPAEDGSGKGAGLVSAIAQRINERLVVQSNPIAEKVHKLAIATNGTNGSHTSATNGHTYSNGHRLYVNTE